ncbi:hypothetical protein KVT40_001927 [Elsinoe batatas]|uniref:Cytochrome P450 n=1 Tax=Elsinoe batatas TaxID=2601811 RepID=A0A8K0LDP1_9PEZI|nr:hypothetical protein KVT40_001927 [Elsinoe batatas]
MSPSGKTWQAEYRAVLYANSRATSHLIWYYKWYPTLVWLSKTFSPYYRLSRETPAEGSRIDGEYIAGGVTVSMPAYVAHRNEEIFPDAEAYNPDRWLGEKGKELGPYFIAFSAGARGCIGRNISYLEQTVVLASVVHRYDIELVDPNYVPQRWEMQNYHLSELPIKLRRRDGRA